MGIILFILLLLFMCSLTIDKMVVGTGLVVPEPVIYQVRMIPTSRTQARGTVSLTKYVNIESKNR